MNHRDTLWSAIVLIEILIGTGDNNAARSLATDVLSRSTATFGREHPYSTSAAEMLNQLPPATDMT